jgi:hypothetical protein
MRTLICVVRPDGIENLADPSFWICLADRALMGRNV